MAGRMRHDRAAHAGGHSIEAPPERTVKPLECGHQPVGAPALSNPDRWWCPICHGWKPMRGRAR